MASEHQSSSSSAPNNDFVVREGFPALRLPGNKQQQQPPWIDGDEPLPIHPFWAGNDVFVFHEREELMNDCEVVFSARAKEDDQPYSAGVTYFCPSQMKPRCLLEEIVLRIFRMHTKGLEEGVMIPEQSGAEWWTLVLDEEDNNTKKADGGGDNNNNGDEEEDEGDEVGLHFDADYGLEDQAPNLLLHPRLATVTYLTNYGAPTIVLDKRSPPPDDPEKKKLEGDIRRGWLSHPKIGKHIAFDGRLLHGAPATFIPAVSSINNCTSSKILEAKEPPTKRARQEEERRRITLLVNVWVNHCPLDAELLEDEVCSQLQPASLVDESTAGLKGEPAKSSFTMKDDVDLKKQPVLKKVRLELSSSKSDPDPAGEEEFVLCSHLVTAKYGAPMEDFHGAAASGDLVELDLAEGVLSLEVGGVVEEDEEEEEEEDDADSGDEGKAKATSK